MFLNLIQNSLTKWGGLRYWYLKTTVVKFNLLSLYVPVSVSHPHMCFLWSFKPLFESLFTLKISIWLTMVRLWHFFSLQIPLPPVDEKKKVVDDVDKDRRYAIDASIVRIMKSRKVLNYQQLILECVEQLGRMFKVYIPPLVLFSASFPLSYSLSNVLYGMQSCSLRWRQSRKGLKTWFLVTTWKEIKIIRICSSTWLEPAFMSVKMKEEGQWLQKWLNKRILSLNL